tara:strand:+ start:604 stop:939 length:336 start_codon:yes stop_codon:yes gene_type:complete
MASPTFYIKQNDTTPKLEAFLQDDKGRPVNLTGATTIFHMRLTSDLSAKVSSGSTTLESGTKGHVSYGWSSSDTDTAGIYQAEFQVTFVSGAIETFPNDDYIKVIITDDVL